MTEQCIPFLIIANEKFEILYKRFYGDRFDAGKFGAIVSTFINKSDYFKILFISRMFIFVDDELSFNFITGEDP